MSGGKGSGGSKSYDYYGTFALRFGIGPMTALLALERNGAIVWAKAKPWQPRLWPSGSVVFYEGRFYQTPSDTTTNPPASPWATFMVTSDSRNASGYTPITIEGVGNVRFYWGHEDQQPDPFLSNPAKTAMPDNPDGHEHPAYKGICYAVFEDCLLGRETTSPGNWRAWVQRKPVQSIITGAAAELVDGQCNPAAVVAEALTSKYCAGLNPSELDATSFQAAADKLHARPELAYISPSIERQTQVVGFVDDITENSEFWIRWNSETGKFGL